jgi:hypothetical protein
MTSKNYTEQVSLVMSIMNNLTFLAEDMDGANNELNKVENDLHSSADDHFKENDSNLVMSNDD